MAPRVQEKQLAVARKNHKKAPRLVPVPVTLTDDDLRFCQEFVRDLDIKETALRCGMSAAKARRQLARADINEELARLAGVRMVTEEYAKDTVVARLVEIINFDPADLRDKDGHFLPFHKMPAAARRAIEVFDAFDGPDGIKLIKAKASSKPKALELLARRYGLLQDRVRVDIVQSVLPPEVVALLDTEELEAVKHLLGQVQKIVVGARTRKADRDARRV